MISFKEKHSLIQRKLMSDTIFFKFPDMRPIICEAHNKDKFKLTKEKFLCPLNLTIGQLLIVVRKRIIPEISKNEALYLFINNKIVPTNNKIADIYEKYKDAEDNVLYLLVDKENTFG